MNKSKESLEIYNRELESSSSNDSNEVLAFTVSNYEQQQQQGQGQGRVRKSLDSIFRPRSNSVSSNIDQFSVHHIYGALPDEKIEIKRTQTRATVLSEIATNNFPHDDLKIQEEKIIIPDDGKEFTEIDPELITWEDEQDPANPRNWDLRTKVIMLMFVSFYAFVAPMSSSILSPAMSFISEEFNIESGSPLQAMVVSIQILAWAIGPLIIAPLSEHDNIGRKLVLDGSCLMSLLFNLGCAFSRNTAEMMVFRFLAGIFGCVPMNVCAGVISDMFDANGRNVALASYSLVPLLGPVIAPLVAGFIVVNLQWRWVFYVLCIFNGTVFITALIFFKETYAPTLLKRKADKLRKETGNDNLHTIYEMMEQEAGESTLQKMIHCMIRPITLLFMHPMIVGLGSFMAFTYGFMYLMIVTFPEIFGEQYGFKKNIIGLMYLPMGFGFVLGVVFWTFCIGKVYKYLVVRNNGEGKPEFRLPCLIFCSLFIPVGLIWFGWSAQKKLHWIMPGIGSALFSFGLVCVFQTTQNYLIDMNVRYAASSVAAAALFRSLFGFAFPLFANKMYGKLGYGWANTMCAFIGIALGVPFPIFCYLYGERIRNWADKRIGN
ncbi:uncharacterized protein SPAPADRAFT_141554 [Spathaspora passalidarum NRRL Y-27907]|uniref:Major facilitator superfamily (MFS) profile domain-containing protein n=1 Tax=Spathaspora passalidarum (strain NRRL Y-27907 / 11-Y1) TaxID=619300 RepID=G3AQL7_SPAPN|nr:uncharacterized protein SPAPADRAFT_141554 [Spathaspora passalidarum NRRL Y-27907]EGW31564.1 hypothetical protein SPAPADRAFT_141554 [Spathaspora passalidarum NRRL Y-27907]